MMRPSPLLVCALVACGEPTAVAPSLPVPGPPPGLDVIPLLHTPIPGPLEASNPFDHAALLGDGVLDHRGVWVSGSPGHRAWDLRVPVGTPVSAMADGVVSFAGPVPTFRCGLLDRDVSDQLAVWVRHQADDGTEIETRMEHLDSVDVSLGQSVSMGEILGTSGNSGCSNGPHVHLEIRRHMNGRVASVDPYGWAGEGPDPWANARGGAPPAWLWAEAPVMVRSTTRAPDVPDAGVYIRDVVYSGWDDEHHPHNESLHLEVDPRVATDVSLEGWSVVSPGGHVHPLPTGTRISVASPLTVEVGPVSTGPGVTTLALDHAILPDGGGVVSLRDETGATVHRFSYGRESAQAPPSNRVLPTDACPDAELGCVPMGLPGAVGEVRWSPTGTWIAAVVGDGGTLALVRPDSGEVVVVDSVAGGPGAPRSVAHPRWLDDEVLIFDAERQDGQQQVWTVIPGLPASPAFAVRPGQSWEVVDASAGTVLLMHHMGADATLASWTVGDAAPRSRSSEVLPEEHAVLAPDGRVAFARGGSLFVQGPGDREDRWGRLPAPVQGVAWVQGWVYAQSAGTLLRFDGNPDSPPRVIATGLSPVGFSGESSATRVVVVGTTGQVRLADSRGERGLEQFVHELVALSMLQGFDDVRLAWSAPVAAGRPAALFLSRKDDTAPNASEPPPDAGHHPMRPGTLPASAP